MSGGIQEDAFWSKVNQLLKECSGECVPKCIQVILNCCGFNHPASWRNFSDGSISEINEHMRKFSRRNVRKLLVDCTLHGCPTAHYKNLDEKNVFTLLPGHRVLITEIAKCIEQDRQNIVDENFCATLLKTYPDFSLMMKEIIQSAIGNSQVSKYFSRYTDIMKYFATYVFNMCGRSCYTFLYKNLPLPSPTTVCK